MLKVTGSITVEFESNGEKIEQEILGSEFRLEEGSWRSLGDDDHQYEALFIYSDENFRVIFQATFFQGKITAYACTIKGAADIVEDNIGAEYNGSRSYEGDYCDAQ